MGKTSHTCNPGLCSNSCFLRSQAQVCWEWIPFIKPATFVNRGWVHPLPYYTKPLKESDLELQLRDTYRILVITSLAAFIQHQFFIPRKVIRTKENTVSWLKKKKNALPPPQNKNKNKLSFGDNKTNFLVTNKMLAHLLGCSGHPWDPVTIPSTILTGAAMCNVTQWWFQLIGPGWASHPTEPNRVFSGIFGQAKRWGTCGDVQNRAKQCLHQYVTTQLRLGMVIPSIEK